MYSKTKQLFGKRLVLVVFAFVFVSVSAVPANVFAQSIGDAECPDKDMSQLDCDAIQWDWPDWVPVLADDSDFGCSTANTTSLVGNNNTERVWNYLRGQGLTPVAAAGVMGNFSEESGFDPAIKQNHTTRALPDAGDGVTGYGLAQWTSQGRQAGLFENMRGANLQQYYGEGWGHPERDRTMPQQDNDKLLLLELNYAWGDDTAGAKIDTTTIKGIKDKLNAATTEKGDNGSTVLFHSLYERSGDNAEQIQERVTAATKILGDMSDVTTVSASTGCTGTIGGVSTLDDTIAWAQRFMTDTRNKYSGSAPAIASTIKDPRIDGSLMRIATWPESTSFICWGAYGCDECTTLSGWFVTNMTGYTYGGGNGGEVVGNLKAKGVPTGKTPKPLSVFSYYTPGYGHTGLVLGVLDDGSVITLENNWPSNTLSARKYNITKDHPTVEFAYVGDKLKVEI